MSCVMITHISLVVKIPYVCANSNEISENSEEKTIYLFPVPRSKEIFPRLVRDSD